MTEATDLPKRARLLRWSLTAVIVAVGATMLVTLKLLPGEDEVSVSVPPLAAAVTSTSLEALIATARPAAISSTVGDPSVVKLNSKKLMKTL